MLESVRNGRDGILYNKIYLNLRSRFFLIFFLFVIVPFLILGIIAYQRSKAAVEHNFHSLSQLNLKHISWTADHYITEILQFTDALSKDPSLLSKLPKGKRRTEGNRNMIKLESPTAVIYAKSNKKLKNISFLSGSDTYQLFTAASDSTLSVKDSIEDAVYQSALKNPETCQLIGTRMRFYSGGSYTYVISVSKGVKDPKTGKFLGAFLVDFDYNSLVSLLKPANQDEFKGSELYITDSENHVMYSTDKGLLTLKLAYPFMNSSAKPQTVSKDKKEMYMLSSRLPNSSWKACEFIPLSNLTKNILSANFPFILSLLICLILLFIFPVVLLSMFFKPLSKLSIAISGKENSEYSHGRFTGKAIESKKDMPDDEGTPNIDGLINKVYYSRLKQKEVQLVALQNQINPHFLYNTLESIRGAALHNGIQSIASMAKNLSSFFRYSIGEEVLVPIRDEIQHLENYIAIQNFRHDDKFELVYKLPEELYDYKILKLTLQPLVENSIKHGLEMKIGKGKIKIDILGMESIIKIRVFDDGIGMPPEKIAKLNRNLEDDIPINNDTNAGSGVGVRNVNSRIKLYFGEQYGLRYLGFTEGTTVEVTFPAVK